MPPRRRKPTQPLTGLESEVMGTVWDLDGGSSTEIVEAFTRSRKLAPTTVRTVLVNLESKGYVRRVPSLGRAHHYVPNCAREVLAKDSLTTLVSQWFGGSPRRALTTLLEDERLAAKDLEEIRAMIEAARKRRRGGAR